MKTKHIHGGNIYNKAIGDVEYDFSSNINPFGISKLVKEKMIEEAELFERYPDPEYRKLKDAISKHYDISTDYIVCGNGASELIYKIMQVIDNKNVLVANPTFSEYELAAKQNKKEIKYYNRLRVNDFEIKEDIIDEIEENSIIVICCPNNPTGDLIDIELLQKIIEVAVNKKSIVLLDFSFIEFCDEYEKYQQFFGMNGVICLMAFTKFYGMPGIRLGFTISNDEIINYKLKECGDCWSVSSPAQVAGYYALMDEKYIHATKKWIETEREYLFKSIKAIGYKAYKPAANFILIEAEDEKLDEKILEYKIMIRNCESFTFEDKEVRKNYYRVAVRDRIENEKLIDALKKIKDMK